MRQLAFDPVFLIAPVIEGCTHQMAESVCRLLPVIADPLEHSPDGTVAQWLAGIVSADEYIVKVAGYTPQVAQHGNSLRRQRRQVEIAALHALAALADRPKSGIEV